MPFPKLMQCYIEPTYPKMVIIYKEIHQNFATISLPYSSGHAEFLGIMMPEALCSQHLNEPFQLPNDLGEYPDDIPADTSAQ